MTFLFYYQKGNFVGENAKYDPYHNWLTSFKYGVFHSISAINNAGFDIFSNNSLVPYYSVYSIQIIFIILLVIGGIGYPVIYDIQQYIKHKIRRRTDFRFSLFTKISCISYLCIFVVGLTLTFIFETTSDKGIWKNPNLGSDGDKIMALIFQTFSTRNAGFGTTNLQNFTPQTITLFSIMMFIGSAPSSTAGGIRTTTFLIILLAIWNKIRGVNGVRIFKKRIDQDVVYSSFLVLGVAIFLVIFNIFICYTSLDTMWGSAPSGTFGIEDIIFEVSSAFGTTGLSTGLTPYLNVGSKIFLIILMFIGQLGTSSTILIWKTKNNNKQDYDFPEESLMIG